MSNTYIIILAISMAFCWLNFNRWLEFKPFNCMMCMSGWLAMLLAIVFGPDQYIGARIIHAIALWFVGCFAGALFEAIKYRWL